MKHTQSDLKQMQSLPLSAKILMTKRRITDWYEHYNGQVYVSFSGGKDSTVLLHIARELYPDIEAVFINTGLEYPEIQQFVKTFDNVTILRPKMRFDEVIKKYGYPIISKEVASTIYLARKNIESGKTETFRVKKMLGEVKRNNGSQSRYDHSRYKPLLNADFKVSANCCDIMKKSPAYTFGRKSGKYPIIATTVDESSLRKNKWLQFGCNAFEAKHPQSTPLSFWTEQDILQYIKQNNLPLVSIYGKIVYESEPEQMRIEDFGLNGCGTDKLKTTGCDRTGCIFCAFGAHLEKGESRFERLKRTHPRQYEYCIGGGEYVDGVWQPNKQGLGMGHVFDELNKIYGDNFIKY